MKLPEELLMTYRDDDCPGCGFPEMTMLTLLTDKPFPIAFSCSKRCGWFALGKDLHAAMVAPRKPIPLKRKVKS